MHAIPIQQVSDEDIRPITDITFYSHRGRVEKTEAVQKSYFRHDLDGKIFFKDTPHLIPWATTLFDACRNQTKSGKREHNLESNGFYFRVQEMDWIDGRIYKLRNLFDTPPTLDRLTLPAYWRDILMLEQLPHEGGLVIFAGAKSNAKTTVMMGTLVSNVAKYSGHGLTIEAPFEYYLGSHHPAPDGPGTIDQIDASIHGFPMALRDAARAFPKNPYQFLAIGEVRDPETALSAVAHANSGDLVYLTIHASQPYEAVDRILNAMQGSDSSPSTEGARQALARAIRVLVVQNLGYSGRPRTKEDPFPHPIGGTLLYSANKRSKLSQALRDASPEALDQVVTHQQRVFEASIDDQGRPQQKTHTVLSQLGGE